MQDPKIELLKSAVEKTFGAYIKYPRDFEQLSMRIQNQTGLYLSSTTLKRLFGYLQNEGTILPRKYTLDTLARYVGYMDYDTFCKTSSSVNTEVQSDFMHNECIKTCNLAPGTRLRIMWKPDRSITIRYEGQELFYIEKALNTKLSAGDTFMCYLFLQGEPLQLTRVIHEGGEPCNFVCGRLNGITFMILPHNEEEQAVISQ